MEYFSALMTAWIAFFIAPFRFTFTDPGDYICIGFITIVLILIAIRHFRRPYPPKWFKRVSIATYVVTVATPLILLSCLYLLSFHVKHSIGHWPQHMVSDPGLVMQTDPVFKRLYTICQYASAFEGFGLYVWLGLMLHLGPNIFGKKVVRHVVIFVLVWVVAVCEPGGRFMWWVNQPGVLPEWLEHLNLIKGG